MAQKVTDKNKSKQDPGKVELKHPFTFDGIKIDSVTFPARMKAKAILDSEAEMQARGIINPGEAYRTFYLVCQATGIDPEALEEMDISDYLKLANKANGFL